VTQLLTQPTAAVEYGFDIDTRSDALFFKDIKEILGANISGGPWGERTSAHTSNGSVKQSGASVERSETVGNAGVTGVVEVTTDANRTGRDERDQPPDRAGSSDTDRVSTDDLVGTCLGCDIGQLLDLANRNTPLERAAERDGQTDSQLDALSPSALTDSPDEILGFGSGAPLISLAERICRADRQVDPPQACC
jgi:hypothetical protein